MEQSEGMILLAEIYRHPQAPREGRAVCREAVRGIVHQSRRLLMIYSDVQRDYKFPGGGREEGETLEHALCRELREECGAQVDCIESAFGRVIEYDLPIEQAYDLFRMTSYYYLCRIQPQLGKPHLDAYEAALGFRPVWVDVDEAIRANRVVLAARSTTTDKCTARETFVLEQVRERLLRGEAAAS